MDYRGYLAVALSQSGATPEMVEHRGGMRRAGAVVVGITNEADSPLAAACELTLLTDAGAELAVPATKTVTAQMLAVAAIAAAFDSRLVTAGDLGALPTRWPGWRPGPVGPERAAGAAAPPSPAPCRRPTRWRRVVGGRGWSSPAAGWSTRPRWRPR